MIKDKHFFTELEKIVLVNAAKWKNKKRIQKQLKDAHLNNLKVERIAEDSFLNLDGLNAVIYSKEINSEKEYEERFFYKRNFDPLGKVFLR